MDIGLALPQCDLSVPRGSPTPAGWAERAEALGFASVWVPDHRFLGPPAPGGESRDQDCDDPLVSLAAAARRTTRVRLGTLALCTPLRPATLTAKALASLDVVSGGRVIAGLAAGRYRSAPEATGAAFELPGARLARLDEAVQVVKGMFAGGPFSFDGRHESAAGARCLPRPVQRPGPPVWVRGRGEGVLEVAARHADGWSTVWRWAPDDWAARSATLDRVCRRVGRDPASVTRAVGLCALAGEDVADLARRFRRLARLSPTGVLDGVTLEAWRRGRLVGTPRQIAAQLDTWRELGVGTLVVSVGARPFESASADDVEMLAAACRL